MSLIEIKAPMQFDTLTEDDIVGEEFEMIDSISSGSDLRFGGCESKSVRFTALYDENLKKSKGKYFFLTYHGVEHGKFWIDSVNVSDDRNTIEIIAYDYMYTLNNMDISEKFNQYLKDNDDYAEADRDKIGTVWRALLTDIGYRYDDSIYMRNDNIAFARSSNPNEKITMGQLLKIICEMNCRFGYIKYYPNSATEGIDKFDVMGLVNTTTYYLYPYSMIYPGNTAYPFEKKNIISMDDYFEMKFDDFTVNPIGRFEIQASDYSPYYGTGNNKYLIKSNQLTKNYPNSDRSKVYTMCGSMQGQYISTNYSPINSLVIQHNPNLKVGDNIRAYSLWNEPIDSVILSKTTKGIVAAKDTIVSKGTEIYIN